MVVKGNGPILFFVLSHALHSLQAAYKAFDSAGKAHDHTDPNDPIAPTAMTPQPQGQQNKSGKGQCGAQTQLGQPNDQAYVFHSAPPYISFLLYPRQRKQSILKYQLSVNSSRDLFLKGAFQAKKNIVHYT
jgi:hypothetical protein